MVKMLRSVLDPPVALRGRVTHVAAWGLKGCIAMRGGILWRRLDGLQVHRLAIRRVVYRLGLRLLQIWPMSIQPSRG